MVRLSSSGRGRVSGGQGRGVATIDDTTAAFPVPQFTWTGCGPVSRAATRRQEPTSKRRFRRRRRRVRARAVLLGGVGAEHEDPHQHDRHHDHRQVAEDRDVGLLHDDAGRLPVGGSPRRPCTLTLARTGGGCAPGEGTVVVGPTNRIAQHVPGGVGGLDRGVGLLTSSLVVAVPAIGVVGLGQPHVGVADVVRRCLRRHPQHLVVRAHWTTPVRGRRSAYAAPPRPTTTAGHLGIRPRTQSGRIRDEAPSRDPHDVSRCFTIFHGFLLLLVPSFGIMAPWDIG